MHTTTPAPTCRTVVDLDAVTHNTRVMVEAARGARVMAVVKADGYGHGAVAAAQAALRGGATALGVTSVAEALALRAAGIDAEILAWMFAVDDDVAAAPEAGIDLSVPSPEHLDTVLDAARRTGRRVRVTPKIDTGLGRSGIALAEWSATLGRLVAASEAGLIEVTGLMAHFASAEVPGDEVSERQAAALRRCVTQARERGLECSVNHHANSAGTMLRPGDGFEMVRPGIALYGLSPVDPADDPEGFGARLWPAMTFSATVLAVKDLAEGEGVSYGHTWHAPRDTTVALVAAGYADGVWRLLSNRMEVSVRGRRFPQVGRVCMDQFVIDLGPRGPGGEAPHGVHPGDDAVLFGDGADGGPTAAEWADLVGTIHYEVVTAVRGRAGRRHHVRRATPDAADPPTEGLA